MYAMPLGWSEMRGVNFGPVILAQGIWSYSDRADRRTFQTHRSACVHKTEQSLCSHSAI